MELNQVFEIEVPGLVNTILEYTKDSYVKNYAKLLSGYSYPSDKEKIVLVLVRLLEWYKDKIEDIKKNQFVFNKIQHEKSLVLIQCILQEIDNEH